MSNVDSIFDLFGGPAAVGRIIGKSTEHAATMRRRGSIPVRYWPALIEAAREKGETITADDFLRGVQPQNEAAA